jgi:adenylate cyclase
MSPEGPPTDDTACLRIPYPEGERRVALENGATWKLGRTSDNHIVLPSELASRQHALIQRMENGEYCLFDLGSRNGTFLNGARVTIPAALKDADRISIGDFVFTFHGPKMAAAPLKPGGDTLLMGTVPYFAQQKTSVLVVDVRGFTKIAQTLDPSVLSQMIGSLFRKGGEIMQKRGSWGQKYIGDALMSVWVHNSSKPEAQVLSILESLHELVGIAASLQEAFHLPFAVRVGAGINSGAAALGNAGSKQHADYTALGDTVNAAFRYEAATREIGFDLIIGEETMAFLRQCAGRPERFFEQKLVSLKGYDRPCKVWAATFAALHSLVAECSARPDAAASPA